MKKQSEKSKYLNFLCSVQSIPRTTTKNDNKKLELNSVSLLWEPVWE